MQDREIVQNEHKKTVKFLHVIYMFYMYMYLDMSASTNGIQLLTNLQKCKYCDKSATLISSELLTGNRINQKDN